MSNASRYHPDKLLVPQWFCHAHTLIYTRTHTYCRVSYSQFLITRLRRLQIKSNWRKKLALLCAWKRVTVLVLFFCFIWKNYKRNNKSVFFFVCVKGSSWTHGYTPLWDVQLKMEDQVLWKYTKRKEKRGWYNANRTNNHHSVWGCNASCYSPS